MKRFLLLTGIGILGLVIYMGSQVYSYAKGVQADTPKFIESFLKNQIQNGDIIFHTSNSSQSKAIQIATNSPYSHMGIIYDIENNWFVYEAVQPVKLTPLDAWIKRGNKGHYVIKRLKNADEVLSQQTLIKMKSTGEKYLGRDYDLLFEWSNEKIYCSELVWKIYKEGAGIEIGSLGQYSDFDLSHPAVAQKVAERFAGSPPLKEKVISPAEMFNSNKLETVFKN